MRYLELLMCAVVLAACSPIDALKIALPDSDTYSVTRNIAYEDGERHTLDIYKPAHPLPGNPVLVFLYGGEWKYGAKGQYGFVAAPLAEQGVTVVVPDYRLYPPTPFPGFIQDSADAVAWTHAHIAQYGGNPAHLFVAGHSAGAYNAAMLAFDPEYLARDGMKPGDLSGFAGIAGPYDFLPITWPELKPVFDVQDQSLTQPITYANGHAPPALFMAGQDDTTVNPMRNTDGMYRKVLADGGNAREILYPGLDHIGVLTAFSPLFRGNGPVLRDLVAFITSNTGAAGTSP